jgi:glycosyltransferase involved in cell wall biosynthesis
MPLSVIESMSYGIPCVVTDVTGNNDLIAENLTGFLYSPEDPQKAAQRIVQLSKDDALWQKLSSEARASASAKFNFRDRALEIEQVYYKALKS